MSWVHEEQAKQRLVDKDYHGAISVATLALTSLNESAPERLAAARMQLVLAEANRGLNQFQEARDWFQKAMPTLEALLDPADPDRLEAIREFAHLTRHALAQPEEAERILRGSIRALECSKGGDCIEMIPTLRDLAAVLREKCEDEAVEAESESTLRRVLVTCESQLGPDQPETANSLVDLGHFFEYSQGDLSREFFTKALVIREKILGKDHPDVAELLMKLLEGEGHEAQDENRLQRVIAIYEGAFGKDSFELCSPLQFLAEIHRKTGRLASMEAMLKRLIEIQERRGISWSEPLRGLGLFYWEQGRLEEARECLERERDVYRSEFGTQNNGFVARELRIARLFLDLGQIQQAKGMFKDLLTILEAIPDPNHKYIEDALDGLGKSTEKE